MDKETIAGVYRNRKSYQQFEVDDGDIQLKYIRKYIPDDTSLPILDAGCGNGRYALKLKGMGYSNISAVDLFDSIPVDGIDYHKASIENLPFEDLHFAFVYANSVIYYPRDTKLVINELKRVLKPGGVLLITAHTRYSLFTLKRVIQRFFNSGKAKHLKGVRFKSAAAYRKLLQDCGFEVVLVDGFLLSFVWVPSINLIIALCNKYLKTRFQPVRQQITRNRCFARLKSEIAYHMILAAVKK